MRIYYDIGVPCKFTATLPGDRASVLAVFLLLLLLFLIIISVCCYCYCLFLSLHLLLTVNSNMYVSEVIT